MAATYTRESIAINNTGILYFSPCGFDFGIELKSWIGHVVSITQYLGFGLINASIDIYQITDRVISMIKSIRIPYDLLRNNWIPAISARA